MLARTRLRTRSSIVAPVAALTIAAIAVGALGWSTHAARAATEMATSAADRAGETLTTVVRERTLRPNTEDAIPAYTCPVDHPYLLDRDGGPNHPRGVVVLTDPNITAFLTSSPTTLDGYATGWSADPRRATALHFDPKFEAEPQSFSVVVTCTSNHKRAYAPGSTGATAERTPTPADHAR